MDFTPVVAQVWGMLIWFIPAALLLCLLMSPWPKGHIGELLVQLFAHWQLDKQTYRRLHNVTQNTADGTTQIDHIFLSPYGIFVLETKNTSGWIFGSEKQAQWTRTLYKRTFEVQNPPRHNYKHLKAPETYLGVNPAHLTRSSPPTFQTEVQAKVPQNIGFIDDVISLDKLGLESSTCRQNGGNRRLTAQSCRPYIALLQNRRPNTAYLSPAQVSAPKQSTFPAPLRAWC